MKKVEKAGGLYTAKSLMECVYIVLQIRGALQGESEYNVDQSILLYSLEAEDLVIKELLDLRKRERASIIESPHKVILTMIADMILFSRHYLDNGKEENKNRWKDDDAQEILAHAREEADQLFLSFLQ